MTQSIATAQTRRSSIRTKTLVAAIALVASVVGVGAIGAGPAAAVGGTISATCVIGPLSSQNDYVWSAAAPAAVAPGATFTVGTSVGYPVPTNATAGFSDFDVVGADPAQPEVVSAPGAPSLAGTFSLTATGAVGSIIEVTLRDFGAGAIISGHGAIETCTPDRRLVVAQVLIGVPRVSVGDAAVVEGNIGTRSMRFAVSLSRPAATDVTVPYATGDVLSTAGVDYDAVAGTVTIPAGHVSGVISVPIRGDTTVEPTERFKMRLGRPIGADRGRVTGTGRILDDDPPRGFRVSVGDAAVVSGTRGTRTARITVSLSEPSTAQVTVGFTTADGDAVAPDDYTAVTGTLTIPPGVTSGVASVPVRPDRDPALAEHRFAVRLTSTTVGAFGRQTGTVRIIAY